MRLIVGGSTGFVATEVIRQALSDPAVTSIVGLGRRETRVPSGLGHDADVSKFKSVVCDDFQNYSENVKQELAEADACIWTIAVTPSRLKTMSWEDTCMICRDYAVESIKTIAQLPRDTTNGPFRFVYISGHIAERDPAKKPWVLGDYSLMRGETESRILELAQESNGAVEAYVAKPGLIDGERENQPDPSMNPVSSAIRYVVRMMLPRVHVRDMSAALLDQVVHGFEKETLMSADMTRIGQKALALKGSE